MRSAIRQPTAAPRFRLRTLLIGMAFFAGLLSALYYYRRVGDARD